MRQSQHCNVVSSRLIGAECLKLQVGCSSFRLRGFVEAVGGGFILHPLAMCQDVRLLRYLLMRIASGFSSLLNEDSI